MSDIGELAAHRIQGFRDSFLANIPLAEQPSDKDILTTIFEMAATVAHVQAHHGMRPVFETPDKPVNFFSFPEPKRREAAAERPPFQRLETWLEMNAAYVPS